LQRLTGDGQHTMATLWHRSNGRSTMLWPLWRQPLTPAGVQVLIEHPSLAPVSGPASGSPPAADPPPVAVRSAAWPRLGIIGLYGAERLRIPGQDYQRPLSPLSVQVLD